MHLFQVILAQALAKCHYFRIAQLVGFSNCFLNTVLNVSFPCKSVDISHLQANNSSSSHQLSPLHTVHNKFHHFMLCH